jgi:hypothetical protein
VGIGTSSPEETLDIEGKILISGTDPLLRMERGDGFNSDVLKVESSTDNLIIGDSSLDQAIFEVDSGEAMRIDRGGNCFIDRTSFIDANACVLSVGGSNQTAINAYRNTTNNGAGVFNWFSDVGGSENKVGQLESNGDIVTATGSYGSFSDERLKQDIVNSSSQWDDIKALQFKKYRLIKNVEVHGDEALTMLGVIAQDLEAAGMNGLVKSNVNEVTGEEYKSVKYSILYMKAVKALQEAMEKIEALESRIETLENQ